MTIIKPNTAFPTGADWPSATARAYIADQLAIHIDTVAEFNSADFENAVWVFVKATGRLYRLDLSLGAADNGVTILADNVGRRYVAVTAPSNSLALDAVGPAASRTTHDTAAAGFVYGVTDAADFQIYVKATATSGDWAGPFTWRGPTGASGGFTGSESAVGRLLDTDTVPVKVGATAYMAPVAKLRGVVGQYPRAGTMSDKTGDSLLFLNGTVPSFVDPTIGEAAVKYNGATIAGVAAFFHNNSSFGGSGSALDASVQALINDAKAVDSIADPGYAYGQSFWLARLTAGAGTTAPGSGSAAGTYLALYPVVNPLINKAVTARVMMRVTSGIALIQKGSGSALYVNGTEDTSAWVALGGSFKHFVEHIPAGGLAGRGYAEVLKLNCSPGAIVEFALPDFCAGHVNLPFHVRPLLAGNRT